MYGDVSASWDDLPEDEDEDEEYEYDAAEAATDASEDASATMAVDVMASPESVWRCLSRGENLSEFVPTLLVAKRGPKSYGSTIHRPMILIAIPQVQVRNHKIATCIVSN